MAANQFKLDGERVDSAMEFIRKEKDNEWKNLLYYPETFSSDSRKPLVFEGKRFIEVSFKDTDISNVRFIRCRFERCLLIGATLTDCEFIDCKFLETNTDKCKITRCLIDPRDFEKNFDLKNDTNIAIDLYQELYKNLTREHQPDLAAESLYQMKRAEYYHLNSQLGRGVINYGQYAFKKLRSRVHKFVSGYGMKSWRVARFLLIVIAFFSAVNYWLRFLFAEAKIRSFVDAVYFTCVTVTTVGFGDIVPTTQWGRILISFEALTGLLVISLFLSAVASRVLRSR